VFRKVVTSLLGMCCDFRFWVQWWGCAVSYSLTLRFCFGRVGDVVDGGAAGQRLG
jgi:hypothetical protein